MLPVIYSGRTDVEEPDELESSEDGESSTEGGKYMTC